MKLLTVLCFSAMVVAAQPKAAQPTATAPGIPAGAVKAEDGYHFTDPQGRQWVYRETPFGISRGISTTPVTDSAPAACGHAATDSGPACGHPAAKAAGLNWDPAAKAAGPSGHPAPAPEDYIRATDHGDTVSFERPGPFGVYRWERKKPDLDAGERAAWQRRTAAADDRK
jgi:hypothetical protein